MPQLVCYVCGSLGASYRIHVHQRDKGPYFPFLSNHDPPKQARSLSSEGTVDACSVCYLFLNQQWESYEQSRTPAVKRLYWLKRIDDGTFTGAEMRLQGEYAAQVMGLQYSGSGTLSPFDYNYPPGPSSQGIACGSQKPSDKPRPKEPEVLDLSVAAAKPKTLRRKSSSDSSRPQRDTSPKLVDGISVVCYICAKEYPSSLGRFIYALKYTDDEPYFPFLEDLPYPAGAMPLTRKGLTKACSYCRKTLSRQWRFFESNRVPEDQRIYQINDKPIITRRLAEQRPLQEPQPQRQNENSREVYTTCFLCGEEGVLLKLLCSRQPSPSGKHVMFFPFLTQHTRPPNARPLDGEGRALACRACYSYLQRQWQLFQNDGSVPPHARTYQLRPSRPLPEEPKPLNIEISTPSTVTAPNPSTSSTGLLAIAPHVYHCYVCGWECPAGSPYHLRVSPSSGGAEPFFPFLSSLKAASSARPVDNSGQAEVCYFCYHSLIAQWTEHPKANHWLPQYRVRSFICFTCSKEVSRSKVKRVTFEEFPFLREHPRPAGSVRIQVDEAVIVCVACQQTLCFHQKLQSSTPRIKEENVKQDLDDPALKAARTPELLVHSRLSNSSSPDPQAPPFSAGLPAGVASQPLTMVSSATRTTATVTPLNQPSPSNSVVATTAGSSASSATAAAAAHGSSFAAALRKLAKQAGDSGVYPSGQFKPGMYPRLDLGGSWGVPAPDFQAPNPAAYFQGPPARGVPGHHEPLGPTRDDLSPSSMPTNLTSSASKRPGLSGPPTRINSPPVVTIAPSHHGTYLNSAGDASRKDRPGSSSSGSLLEAASHPAAVKQEVDKAPSGDRREDDRPRSKDAHTPRGLSSAAVVTSVPSSTPYEELANRGFQPYRPGTEDVRPPASYFPLDPALYAAYHPTFAPHAFSHPAFRFDDPMLLERYRMMQQPLFPYPPPAMLGAPGLHSLLPPGTRYPAELMAQSPLHFLPGAKLPEHLSPGSADRSKTEDELRREREKEEMEREREREREKEKERQREKEERERQEKERRERERRERERERQRLAERERSPALRPQEDPGGGGRYGPRDLMSMYGLGEKRSSAPHPAYGYPPREANEASEKERERHLMHQQFLREQDLLLKKKAEPNGPSLPPQHLTSSAAAAAPKHSEASLSSHLPHTAKPAHSSSDPPKPLHFHRPFEKSLPNGFEKDLAKPPEPAPEASKPYLYAPMQYSNHLEKGEESSKLPPKQAHHLRPPYTTDPKVSDAHNNCSSEGPHPEFTYRLNSHYNHKHSSKPPALNDPKRLLPTSYSDQSQGKEEERRSRNKRLLYTGSTPQAPPTSPGRMKLCPTDLDMGKAAKRRRAEPPCPLLLPSAEEEAALDPRSYEAYQLTRTSDYKHRVQFLHVLGLEPVAPQRRKELDFIRKVCEWDRQKRNGVRDVPVPSMDPRQPRPPHQAGLSGGTKRKLSEAEPTTDPHQPSLFSLSKPRMLSREFAQEFHESVLQATRQQQQQQQQHEETSRVGSASHEDEEGGSSSRPPHKALQPSSSFDLPQYKATHLSGSKPSESHARVEAEPFRWPGIEVLLDAYQRHVQEQTLERQVLVEQCGRLQKDNRELTQSAEQLSARISDLLQNKQHMEEARHRTQSSLDLLKKVLHAVK